MPLDPLMNMSFYFISFNDYPYLLSKFQTIVYGYVMCVYMNKNV